VREAAADDYRFSTLVKGIVRNSTFRMSVAPEAATAIAAPETASL
jgi:hypothetical protein